MEVLEHMITTRNMKVAHHILKGCELHKDFFIFPQKWPPWWNPRLQEPSNFFKTTLILKNGTRAFRKVICVQLNQCPHITENTVSGLVDYSVFVGQKSSKFGSFCSQTPQLQKSGMHFFCWDNDKTDKRKKKIFFKRIPYYYRTRFFDTVSSSSRQKKMSEHGSPIILVTKIFKMTASAMHWFLLKTTSTRTDPNVFIYKRLCPPGMQRKSYGAWFF